MELAGEPAARAAQALTSRTITTRRASRLCHGISSGATAGLGYDPSGKRIVKRGSGTTKTEAKNQLKEVLRDHEDGLAIAPTGYTVENPVNDWLTYGLAGRDKATLDACAILSRTHVIRAIGARKLRDLSAEDVDKWLAAKAKSLSTRTLQGIHSCLNRAVKRAMARDPGSSGSGRTSTRRGSGC